MKTKLPLHKLMPCLSEEVQCSIREHIPDILEAEVRRKGRASSLTIDEGERACVQVISTNDIDRQGEIMDPKGCDLTDFLKNTIVMWNHDYSKPPVARAVDIQISDKQIVAKAIYSETPAADEIYTLKKEGILKTASVGFAPLEYVFNGGPGWSEVIAKLAQRWSVAKSSLNEARAIITKWALLEYSDVPIPANPNALAIAVGKGMTISDDLMEQLKANTEEEEEKPPTPAPAAPTLEERLAAIKTDKIQVIRPKVLQPQTLQVRSLAECVSEQILRLQGRV